VNELLLTSLRRRARAKGIDEATLPTVLLETIIRDNLFQAVLDEA
jgi:hypothetical protein